MRTITIATLSLVLCMALLSSCTQNSDSPVEVISENSVQAEEVEQPPKEPKISNKGKFGDFTTDGVIVSELYSYKIVDLGKWNDDKYHDYLLILSIESTNFGSYSEYLSTCDSALLIGEKKTQYSFRVTDCKSTSLYPEATQNLVYSFTLSNAYPSSVSFEDLSDEFVFALETSNGIIQYELVKNEIPVEESSY